MKQMLRRALSLLLALVLTAGLCTTALAVKYPDSYWPLQDEWIAADAAQDPARVIAVAQKIYDLLMPYGLDADVCNNLEPKCQKAAWCCEMQGDIAGAITWLERQRELDQWMNSNGIDKKDMLATSERRLAFLKNASSPKIFALTQNASPYSTGPSLGTWQGSVHEGSQNTGSAELVYIDFLDSFSANDPEYWIRNYNANSPRFAQAAQGGVMEIAWNFTQGPGVVVSASDAQISAAVAAISNIGCSTVLLRLGAEMNNVASCDPAVFQQEIGRAHV